MKHSSLFAGLVLGAFVLAFVGGASAAIVPIGGPIVPCGVGGQGECTLSCIPSLIKNLIDYMMFYIAIPLATIMVLVIGLLFIIAGGNPGKITDAKKRLFTLVTGLAIVFLAWIFVDVTIRLLAGGGGFKVNDVVQPWTQLPACTTQSISSLPPPSGTLPPPPPGGGPSAAGCQSCVTFDSQGIPVKAANACTGTDPCKIESVTALKLADLASNMPPGTWQVTEGYPPTRPHQDPCHEAATCVDANLLGSGRGDPAAISNFITKAENAGLTPVYEVLDNTRRSQLIAAGVPAAKIITVPGITGEHFSLYNRSA